MIQTIINEPKVLASNSSSITFDATNIRTRCAYCCNGGWLDYENGNPIFKIFGNNYNGYYNANFSASISSVTIGAADDYETVSFNRKLRVCPRGNTSITVGSVPSVPTPTTPTTPIETQIPIITNGTFNLSRSNN